MVISNINWIVYSPICLYIFINQQGGFKLLTSFNTAQMISSVWTQELLHEFAHWKSHLGLSE